MGKNIKHNYILNMIYQILALIVPFITTPYIANVLSKQQIGIYNYTFSVVSIFMNFIINGCQQYGVREVAYSPLEKRKNTKLIVELTVLKCVCLLLALIPYIIIIVYSEPLYRNMYIINFFILIGYVIDISWYFQGIEEFKKIVIRNIIIKVFGMISIIILVKGMDDFYIYVVINAAILLIGNLSLWIGIKKYVDFSNIMSLNIKIHIKPSLIFFIPSISSILYAYVDKIFLGIFSDSVEVAYYTQAEKIVKMLITIITAMETVLLPRLSYHLKKGNMDIAISYMYKGIRFVFLIATPLVFGLFYIAPFFIPVFLGAGYEKSIINTRISCILIFSIGVASILGTTVMIPIGKQKIYNGIIVIASIGNCILNLFLIPYLQSYGASLATVITETFITICILYNLREYIKFSRVVKENYKYVVASVIMLCSLKLFEERYASNIQTIIGIGLIGGIVYLIVLIIYKDFMIYEAFQYIMDKIKRKDKNEDKNK